MSCGMATIDNALRGVAAVTAVAAVALVAVGPQWPRAPMADATQQMSDDALQRRADARTKGYSFLLRSDDSRYPGRWCGGTIRYTLDLTLAGAAGLDPGQEAARWATVMQRWTEASGGHYQFVYAGQQQLHTDDAGQIDLAAVAPGTIGVTYVHDGVGDPAYRATAVEGRTAGNGGLQVTSDPSVPGGMLVGDRGFVMIDADDAARLPADGMRQALYQHESGHALGLGHVTTGDSIMNGTLSEDRLTLAAGDRAGLAALMAMPCTP